MQVEITITGNVVDGFTAAELSCIRDNEQRFIGRVYELEDGWHYELPTTVAELGISHEQFVAEIARAKAALASYINRKGANAPSGQSAAAFSLWLMIKSDGTALGRKME